MNKYPIEEPFDKEKAILPFDDGRIFCIGNYKERVLYQLLA